MLAINSNSFTNKKVLNQYYWSILSINTNINTTLSNWMLQSPACPHWPSSSPFKLKVSIHSSPALTLVLHFQIESFNQYATSSNARNSNGFLMMIILLIPIPILGKIELLTNIKTNSCTIVLAMPILIVNFEKYWSIPILIFSDKNTIGQCQ